MIAHRINRERKASSPARLIKYMVAAKGGIDPTSWERTADYILDSANGTTEGEKVASYRVTNCGTDDPADAAILIQATQAANTRSKAEKTYHFVYSFPPGEQPDLETLHAIEDELCAAIGLDEHQRVSAVHIDTDNLHVHVAINKVHPTGLQNIEPYYDQFRLMEACERLEVEHGLQRTFHGLEAKQRHQNRDIELLPAKAPEQRDSLFREHLRNAYDLSISKPPEAKTLNGLRKLSDTRLQRQSADKAEPVRIGAKVASVEAQSGIETLIGYAARELAPAMRQATSWQELHDAAAEHGLEVRQRGAGLVIGEPDSGIWAKASNVGRDLSMKALTDRLGPFQPSERQAEAKANRKRYEP
ncbi:TPA: TraI/MobA(P) family conjugative relaxase, partial [Escherichia coli]